MLGEKIAEAKGRVTTQRVLPNPGGGPKLETSFQASGKLLGVDNTETGTYTAVLRPDGTLYGEGQGVLMSREGDVAAWNGSGVGTPKADGGVSYRGAIYYQSSSARWERLNRVAAVYEFEVDAQGDSTTAIWEWK